MTLSFSRWNGRGALGGMALVGLLALALPLRGQVKDFTIFSTYKALASTLDEVARLVTARQFDQARERLKLCLAKVPDHFEAHYYLALMAYETKDYPMALAYAELSKASLAELDRLYSAEVGRLEAARERTISQLETSLEQADSGPGLNNCREGDIHSAKLAIAMEKRKQGPLSRGADPFITPKEYYFLHGNCLFRLGRQAEAQTQYWAAIKLDSAYAQAWNNLINSLWADRQYDQAAACLRKAEAAKVQITPELRKAVFAAVK